MPDFVAVFALLAVVLTITALVSGFVERAPVSFPLIFLGFGLALGGGGFDVIRIASDDPVLEVVATLTLSLVLFLDAVKLQVDELGKLNRLLNGPNPPIILDVRSRSSYEHDQAQIPASVRVPPDRIYEWTPPEDETGLVVAYCT